MKRDKSKVEMDIRNKPLNERLPESVLERIHQDIGAASMCWTKVEKAGIFESERAGAIANNLCHFMADELKKEKEVN